MLQLKNVSYKVGDKTIINDVTLDICDRFVAITGPNGSGKSTLAKLVAGIIVPTEGRIYLDGEDITDLSISERATKGIGYAFQQPPRFKGITVHDLLNIAAGKTLRHDECCGQRLFHRCRHHDGGHFPPDDSAHPPRRTDVRRMPRLPRL